MSEQNSTNRHWATRLIEDFNQRESPTAADAKTLSQVLDATEHIDTGTLAKLREALTRIEPEDKLGNLASAVARYHDGGELTRDEQYLLSCVVSEDGFKKVKAHETALPLFFLLASGESNKVELAYKLNCEPEILTLALDILIDKRAIEKSGDSYRAILRGQE